VSIGGYRHPYLYDVINYPNKEMEEMEKEELVDELTNIARDAFGIDITKEDVKSHILPVSTMTLALDEEEIIGFSTSNYYNIRDYDIIYLVGTCVLRKYQGNGIFSNLLDITLKEETFKHNGTEIFITRTQNPVLYSGVIKFLDEIYPSGYECKYCKSPNNTSNKKEYLQLGKIFAKEILNGELSDNFVMRKAYGVCMYDAIPRSKDQHVNSLFDKLLNYEKGDAVLIVGKLTYPFYEG